MVDIKPFKGIHYNPKKIKKLDDVMAPPYDIISPKMQDQLYQKHANNYVRLILNKIEPTDTETNNRYTRAHHLLTTWLTQEIFSQTTTSALYPYKIEYTIDNQPITMSGFFTLLKIDPDYKYVKAHERTLSKPKADRLNLMRACKANLEPIQLLYIDQHDTLRTQIDHTLSTPLISVKGYDGFTHTIWRLTDTSLTKTIQNYLKDQILFIADGHHRYQTAINYGQEQTQLTGNKDPTAPFNYRMVILANMFDPGLTILPTHRLITHPNLNIDSLLTSLEPHFTIQKHPIPKNTKPKNLAKHIIQHLKTTTDHKFALYTKNNYYILILKDTSIMDKLAPDRSPTWRTLDVSILHKIIIEKYLQITEDTLEDHVKYTRSDTEALELVNDNTYTLSILMNPTKIEELKTIADAGEHMPQKSTYFLPKMLSGLVMYKIE
ncbi:MAG: DUF1015 domain-containing protein [Candidatus Thermoplasmatota archaeon]|nr:DUF1015 domain-containing protein [Candidatus Thermoplasmatota archaeon]